MNHNLRARNKLWRLLSQLPPSLQCRRRGPINSPAAVSLWRMPISLSSEPAALEVTGEADTSYHQQARRAPADAASRRHKTLSPMALSILSLKSGVIGENPAISEPTRPGARRL